MIVVAKLRSFGLLVLWVSTLPSLPMDANVSAIS
jgi:hypothetical protein